jgi:hypothetical protein
MRWISLAILSQLGSNQSLILCGYHFSATFSSPESSKVKRQSSRFFRFVNCSRKGLVFESAALVETGDLQFSIQHGLWSGFTRILKLN